MMTKIEKYFKSTIGFKMPNLVEIYKHTVHHSKKNRKKYPRPKTVVYTGLNDLPETITKEETVIEVVEKDTIVAALELVNEHKLNPLVLNMASDYNPGGGVAKGSRAQEESLFRRTNYCTHLNKDLVNYPLAWNQVVYTPDVAVIKDRNHKLLTCPEYLTFVACPGIRNPRLNKNGKFMLSVDLHRLRLKIMMIFQTAIRNGHDSLVLGALGCGAFHNPPKQVAEMFKESINRFPLFKRITFAVLGKPNFEVFKKIIIKN